MEENNSNVKNNEDFLVMNIYNHSKMTNSEIESNDNANLSNAPLPITNYNENVKEIANVDNLRNNYPLTEYRNQQQKKNYQLQSLNYIYPKNNLENNRYNKNNINNINNMKKVPIIQSNVFAGQNNNNNKNKNNKNENNNSEEDKEEIEFKKKCKKKAITIIILIFVFLILFFMAMFVG